MYRVTFYESIECKNDGIGYTTTFDSIEDAFESIRITTERGNIVIIENLFEVGYKEVE